ncbi:MAG: AMP-binding protein [Pseudomonadota bacterium]
MIRFGEVLAKTANKIPDAPAVTFEGTTRTWAEVHRRTCNVAAALTNLGLKAGERIAYLGFNSDALFELYFAPSLVGLETVVMNFRWSLEECVGGLEETQPSVLVFDETHAGTARAAAAACPSVHHQIQIGRDVPEGVIAYTELAETDGEITTAGTGGDDTLIIYFTGGTTGRSKGVMISHSNMLANSLGAPPIMGNELNRAQIIIGPMFHMAPGSRIFSAPILNAHTVIMPRFDMVEMMRLIERHEVHAVTMVPTMMHMLLEHPAFGDYDLSSLGPIMLGGSPTPSDLLARAIAAFPQAKFSNGYGMTEMSNLIAALTPEYHVLDGPMAGKLQSVGRPVPYLDVRIFDQDDREVPQGQIGEIVTRGPTVMKGYLNRPDATAEAIRNGWFHTGDMGYFDEDGLLYISGRTKDMIITGGENVYPTEVEDIIASHPSVSQVAVIGIPDDKWGEAVHAIVILTDDSTPDPAELISHCKARLAGYKCPQSITFRNEPFPLSGANKVLKTELRKPYLRPN